MAKKKLYSFDDHPEHKALLPEWGAKSIANVLNCAPMDEAERDVMRAAVDGLYRAANLTPPAPSHVLFVSSPLVGAVAATIASAAWWIRDHPQKARATIVGCVPTEQELMAAVATAARVGIQRCLAVLRGERIDPLPTDVATVVATVVATDGATDGATDDATRGATRGATVGATRGATHGATRGATRGATHGATRGATHVATRVATVVATDGATDGATRGATVGPLVRFMLGCMPGWWRMHDGGNFWGGWVYYLSFGRHVAKRADIDYSKFAHYETLGHAGPRFLHPKFCIISDRPEFIHRDTANRPHCVDGPHIRWRDGVELHHIHGIRVTPRITAGRFTALDALKENNAEVRRVMVDRYNAGDNGRWLRDVNAQVLHSDVDALGHPRRLLRVNVEGDEPYVGIEVTNSTPEPDGHPKLYTLPVDPDLRPLVNGVRTKPGEPQPLTCHNAIASTFGLYGHEYQPVLET